MRAVFYDFSKKKFFLKDVPIPKIKRDEVLIRVRVSSLCGSDLHIIDGALTSKVYSKKEIILGHSFSGVVEKVGSGVKKIKAGDNVFTSNFVWCGRCRRCKNERENLCDDRYIFGMELPGAHAEYIKTPARVVFGLPKDIDFEAGSLITDVFALNFNALKKASLKISDKVLILGVGPIGLAMGMLLKSMNFKKISVFDPVKNRQLFAKKLFGARIINKKDLANFYNFFDVVFEESGSPEALEFAEKSLKRGGRLVIVGVHDKKFNLNVLKAVSRELSIFGVFHYAKKDIKGVLKIIQKNIINPSKIITHRFLLKEAEKAYALLKDKGAGRIVFVS